MAEESIPWPGTTVGDAGPYSDDDWDNVWEILFGSGISPYNNRGVIRNWANELVGSNPAANTVRIATGAALVHGKWYRNTANVDVNVPTPAVNTRIDRIVLRSSWVAQTIRITRLVGIEGGGAPALVQNDTVTWDVPLYQVSITVAGPGTITLTDERAFVSNLVQRKMIQTIARADASSGSTNQTGSGLSYVQMTTGKSCGFEFYVPPDFIALRSAIMIFNSVGTGTVDIAITMKAGACGEVISTHSDSLSLNNEPMTDTLIKCIDVTSALDGIAAGDMVGLTVDVSDFVTLTVIRAFLLVIEYQ